VTPQIWEDKMFAFANVQLYLLQHPNLFPEEDMPRILSRLLEQSFCGPGVYVACIAENILGELSHAFLAEIESDPVHMQLFALQRQAGDRWLALAINKDGPPVLEPPP